VRTILAGQPPGAQVAGMCGTIYGSEGWEFDAGRHRVSRSATGAARMWQSTGASPGCSSDARPSDVRPPRCVSKAGCRPAGNSGIDCHGGRHRLIAGPGPAPRPRAWSVSLSGIPRWPSGRSSPAAKIRHHGCRPSTKANRSSNSSTSSGCSRSISLMPLSSSASSNSDSSDMCRLRTMATYRSLANSRR